MQTEVPMLPVVCSDERKRLTRKLSSDSRISPVTIKNHSACKSAAFLLSKRKQLHPLLGGPYKNSARIFTLSESKPSEKNPIGQRVMSAKMLRVKQLQNQLTDAHYHLNELANENRLLKALQKRQDSALRRYEGTNAELPRIINSHHEELRVLQTKYKKLKAQHKDTCDLLKDKENELHSLQLQNKHLLQLSKDRNLGEREKLQMQVSDLRHRIKQQEETIQTLNRKLALESKSLKHQLNTEVAKHKEAQKHLNKTMEKLKSLEDMLDNREKRLYYNGQLPTFGKGNKNMASQSLTNLSDGRNKDAPNHESQHETLPMLTESESNVTSKISKTSTILTTTETLSTSPKTETMASLQQVRKFRLQKSPHNQVRSARDRLRQLQKEAETERNDVVVNISDPEGSQNPYESMDQRNLSAYETELKKFEQSLDKRTGEGAYKLPKQLKKEFGYSTSETENEDDQERQRTNRDDYGVADSTVKSKVLHARLTRKLPEDAASKSVSKEKETPRPFTEEELERFVNEKLKFKRESLTQEPVKKAYSKAECKAELQQLKAVAGISESDSETDLESESNREKESFDFLLKNAPDDSETEDPNHPIEDFLKFDVNASESESDAEKAPRKRRSKKGKSKAATQPKVAKSPEGIATKPQDDVYDNGQQRLMDITKSWSELQEKIMRERETSENQLKVLESEMDDDFVLEHRRSGAQFNADDVKKLLGNPKSVLTINNKDDLTENIEQKLFEIDKLGKTGRQSRENSVSQENANVKTEQQINSDKNEENSDKVEDAEIETGGSLSEMMRPETTGEAVEETNMFTIRNEQNDNFLSNIEDELNHIDSTQEKLKSLAMENEKQMSEGYRLKGSAELRTKLTSSLSPDKFQKMMNNIQQDSELPKKEKQAKKDAGYKEEMSKEAKMISYNKEKLLAAMKAIDNNDNVEFLEAQTSRRSSASNRSQITENLYRGLPTHAKKKDDLMKELFGDGKADGKVRNGCTKLH